MIMNEGIILLRVSWNRLCRKRPAIMIAKNIDGRYRNLDDSSLTSWIPRCAVGSVHMTIAAMLNKVILDMRANITSSNGASSIKLNAISDVDPER